MKIFFLFFVSTPFLFGIDTVAEWFQEGSIKANLKYYYIETNKNYITSQQTSAHSNTLGGQLGYSTASWNGLKLAATFMTTQPFLLPDNVESSTIGQDNGFRGNDPSKAFSVLGESYVDYEDRLFNIWYGRRVITTPMIGAKKVRTLPSAVQGSEATLYLNQDLKLSLSYIDRFKQRSSDTFSNIIEHALGTDTLSVTGEEKGYTIALSLKYKGSAFSYHIYDLYASNFLNTLYGDLAYTQKSYTLSTQVVSQHSAGKANTNLDKDSSATLGKRINSAALGVRAEVRYKESSFDLVYRNIFRDSSSYDSIITPWDGELLYAYSSTTNNLGQSLYGKGLTAGGAYVGGTQGIKLGYTQKYNIKGIKGFKTHLAYACYRNPLFREDQEDLKAIISYSTDNFSIQLKGIWIDNDTYTSPDGTVNQLDSLTQYHAIVNYKF